MEDNNFINTEDFEILETVEETVERPKYVTKNMATCTGVEFLRQGNRIRHEVEGWLKDTKVLELRKRRPAGMEHVNIKDRSKLTIEQVAALREQNRKNISDMLDACLETHAEETLRVLALMCFLEPEEAEKVPVTELLFNFAQMLGDEGVMNFFTSLTKWEAITTSN